MLFQRPEVDEVHWWARPQPLKVGDKIKHFNAYPYEVIAMGKVDGFTWIVGVPTDTRLIKAPRLLDGLGSPGWVMASGDSIVWPE